MNKFLKSGLSIMLAGAMCCTFVLSGCGKKDATSSDVPQTESKSDLGTGDNTIVAKGNGIKISAETFGHYVYQAAMSAAMADDPTITDLTTVDWDKKMSDGRVMSDVIKENAVNEMIKREAIVKYGKENDITFTDEEREQIKSGMEQYKTEQGDSLFEKTLKSIGVETVDEYLSLYESETIYSKVKSDFDENREKYIKDEKKMKEYKNDNKVSVQHILIKNNSTKYEDPKKTIQEVLERAKGGEDFTQLMKEFNEDTGEPDSGYSFGPGEMVAEFEKASFNLEYDEISDVVESSYGYHVIKRVVGFAEFENYLIDKWNIKADNDFVSNISVSDILKEIADANNALMAAQTEAQAQSGEENNAQDGGKANG